MPTVSVVFRALNEEKWFGDALQACQSQVMPDGVDIELVLVDSGSTDSTIDIARQYGCQIFHIDKSEFTFGRSLNIGCEGATGDILIFISAHCIPREQDWLTKLIEPLLAGQCDYVYGGQTGLEGTTRFSEQQVFAHYFPAASNIHQSGIFCNNANAAITRKAWQTYKFDEDVTGLEDMVLAKAIVADGGQIGYVSDAAVTHIHEETLQQVQRRYFREALTMRGIMPEVQFNGFDFLRCLTAGIVHDLSVARQNKALVREFGGIFAFRFAQYWGTYRGHNEHRELSKTQKQRYYYPRIRKKPASRGAPRRYNDATAENAETKSGA
jgi:glycosyltransferase involved in cell wall biosynthesis